MLLARTRSRKLSAEGVPSVSGPRRLLIGQECCVCYAALLTRS
jgi:hypothetical protein